MLRYDKDQLVVLFVVVALLAGSALWQLRPKAVSGAGAMARPAYVYELAGGVGAPGLYRFDSPQILGSLLAAANAQAVSVAQPDAVVANGSRISVGSAVEIGPMRAQDRINCFLPIALASASAEDLELIPGLGKKTAQAIIAFRDRSGGISSISELTRIKGLGAKRLERFRPYLLIEP